MTSSTNFTEDYEDLLIQNLNDFDMVESNVRFIIKAWRSEEVSPFNDPRIYVEFSPMKMVKMPVGALLGFTPSIPYEFDGQTHYIIGEPVYGYFAVTKCRVSAIAMEKRAHGYDANKLLRKLIRRLIVKVNQDWETILSPIKANIKKEMAIISLPFKVGSEKVYRYYTEFNIYHTFSWIDDPSDVPTDTILELDGAIYDRNDIQVQEFEAPRGD